MELRRSSYNLDPDQGQQANLHIHGELIIDAESKTPVIVVIVFEEPVVIIIPELFANTHIPIAFAIAVAIASIIVPVPDADTFFVFISPADHCNRGAFFGEYRLNGLSPAFSERKKGGHQCGKQKYRRTHIRFSSRVAELFTLNCAGTVPAGLTCSVPSLRL
jgi:hypothetical protein